MAQPGTYTAYRQLKPLEGDVSQDIQQQEENGLRRRALDQAEQREKNNQVDKEAQRKQELWDKHIKPLSNYDTGSKTLNEAQGRLILEAQKEYIPLMGILNNPKSSDEEKLNASLKLKNINNLPENLLAMTKTLTDRDMAYQKGVKEGSLFSSPEYETNFQTGYANKLLALDDNGMPMIAFKDLNGDGQNDLETYDQIQNVVPKYDIQQRFDRNTELLSASKNLQPNANDPALLNDYISNQLYELDGVTPTARLKSFARDAGVTDYTNAEALKKVADNYAKDVLLRVKPDTAQQALDQKIKQDAADEKYRQDKLKYDKQNDKANREAAKEAKKLTLDQDAAGKTSTSKVVIDANGNTVTTTVTKGNKAAKKKPKINY